MSGNGKDRPATRDGNPTPPVDESGNGKDRPAGSGDK